MFFKETKVHFLGSQVSKEKYVFENGRLDQKKLLCLVREDVTQGTGKLHRKSFSSGRCWNQVPHRLPSAGIALGSLLQNPFLCAELQQPGAVEGDRLSHPFHSYIL
jgi:hypothetical protein